jgi:hypothetical protein
MAWALMLAGGFLLTACQEGMIKRIPPEKLAADDLKLVRDIAKKTWNYFELSTKGSGIPADHMLVRKDGQLTDSNYTTITNLGLFFYVLEGAVDLGYLSREQCDAWLLKLLTAMEGMKRTEHGLFYNYFVHKEDLRPGDDRYVSSVDSAWLAAGLLGLTKNANQEIAKRARRFYEQMDVKQFYDPENGQFRLGFSELKKEQDNYHYGQLVSEARIISYVGIAKQAAPSDHWYRVYRTLPADWSWQNQKPQGRLKRVGGLEFFQGYYEVDGQPIVPSWGGSLFEFLMPMLLVPEITVAPYSFKLNNAAAVAAHIKFAENAGYVVWGMSPCAIPAGVDNFKYGEFGVAKIGSKGYPDAGIVTPHVSALAIEIDTQAVIANFREFIKNFPTVYTEYGFYDAVNVKNGEVAPVYLGLDQAMIFLALHNYLTNGKTRERFYTGEMENAIGPLLKRESFFY